MPIIWKRVLNCVGGNSLVKSIRIKKTDLNYLMSFQGLISYHFKWLVLFSNNLITLHFLNNLHHTQQMYRVARNLSYPIHVQRRETNIQERPRLIKLIDLFKWKKNRVKIGVIDPILWNSFSSKTRFTFPESRGADSSILGLNRWGILVPGHKNLSWVCGDWLIYR